MIDTHTHLTDPKFANDLTQVLLRARASGVTAFVSPSTTLSDSESVVGLTKLHNDVYGLVGLYPGEADQLHWEQEIVRLRDLLTQNTKVVGIGEIGLDEESYRANPVLETRIFEAQLQLALELDYPVVIHSRGTQEPIQQVMEKYDQLPRGHFHCFGGSLEWLEYVLSRGFYVGFDGNVMYKNAHDLRALAQRVPLERLLLETDSPYLPPEGHRGERNEPGNVRIIAAFLAELRGETIEALIGATTVNARTLFRI
jgi:TatD DNase family protein